MTFPQDSGSARRVRNVANGRPRLRALQLRYLTKLYVKELVLRNFAGVSAEQLLERTIELSLYAEEKLKG